MYYTLKEKKNNIFFNVFSLSSTTLHHYSFAHVRMLRRKNQRYQEHQDITREEIHKLRDM